MREADDFDQALATMRKYLTEDQLIEYLTLILDLGPICPDHPPPDWAPPA